MNDKVIITVAPTGSIPTRKDNPNLPVTAEEVAEETRRACEAGASVVHLHARDPNTGKPTPDIDVYRDYLAAVRDACPIITQITTGGGATTLNLTPEQRLAAVEELYLGPLMETEDAHEGLTAFLEKRAPVWKDK